MACEKVTLEISDIAICTSRIRKSLDNDEIIFELANNKKYISGMVLFTMFDTYGFPPELTKEILGEDGYEVDMDGFEILRNLSKEKSSGTFKNMDGWMGVN